ncbi:MAG: TonB-dependent receptor domain-containing protein [Bryobacteraceae bacterium]
MRIHKAIGLILCVLCSAPASAQDARGSITGTVADAQSARIPAAAVAVTNTETGTAVKTATNQTGVFEVHLLNPGTYSIAVEAPGFKRTVRSGLELNVASRLNVDFVLEVGQVSESVNVTEAAPMLETTSASGGRVIDNRQLRELPFTYMNPFTLTALATGMQWTGAPQHQRPFDNAGVSAYNTAGAVGQNEYMIDGAPVTGVARRVGFVPPADAVGEFKLETTSFDASYGHTSGAVINVMTKAGTNRPHGTLYEQHYQARWNATPHFQRLAFEDQVRRGLARPDDPRQPSGRSNNFGGTFGGPVYIPKLYNGKDKFFAFFSYNGIYQTQMNSAAEVVTVPKMAWRNGDFSDLLAIDATKYQIYDPRSARQQGSNVVRMPFPGNRGVPVLNPMYKIYERFYPAPNDIPGLVSPEGLNNFLSSAPATETFNSFVNRYDYNITDRHRLFGRWFKNHRNSGGDHWSNGVTPEVKIPWTNRYNRGIGGDWIWVASSSTTVNASVNVTQYSQGSLSSSWTSFKPSDFGLPAYLDQKVGDMHSIPGINFSTAPGYGGAYPTIDTAGTTGEMVLQLNTVRGKHSFKYGWQERRYWIALNSPGNNNGSFSFNNTYMRSSDNDTRASNLGLEWASFMMGAPSAIAIDNRDSAYFTQRYRGLYVQDDWRATSRLNITAGLRYERESPMRERFNRAITGGFVYDAKLPFTDMAQAAYARNPLAELAAAQFQPVGGIEYMTSGKSDFTDGTHHLLPRIGGVYQLDGRTVIRAGYGWYYDTFNPMNTPRPDQTGFSLATNTIISSDLGLNFCCGVGAAANLAQGRTPLNDPFPVRSDGSRFDTPIGASMGLSTLAGGSLTFVPRDFVPAWQQRWRIGVQRQLARDIVIEASYNGATAKQVINQTVNYLPSKYWATGNVRNQAVDDDMNRNVPNPFLISNLSGLQTSNRALYDYLSKQSFFRSTTIRKHQLLRAFPQMSGLTGVRPGLSAEDARGGNRYRDLQFQFEKRFSRGLNTAVMYTWAHGEAQDYYANQFDPAPSWRSNSNVRPHRLVWTGIYELPFGKGRTWAAQGVANHLAGGWQLSWIYQRQSGPPTSWGNLFFYGDVNNIGSLLKHDEVHSKDIHVWFDPNIIYTGTGAVPGGFQGFEGRSANQPGSYHVRVFPPTLEALRADGIRTWDAKLLRRFEIKEHARFIFSADFLNLTNHTNFSSPQTNPTNRNFGRVTAQNGLGRIMQFNLRFEF